MIQKDLTFFLIDDDEDEHELFQIALEELNPSIKCITSSDCDEAMYQLKKKQVSPDFIFLDLNMPIKGGRECLCELKNDPELNSIPVVIFTTSSDPRVIEETINLGATHFMTKPSKISELSSLINNFLLTQSSKS